MLKGTPLRSISLKMIFLHRSAWALKTERYAKDNLKIYSKMN
jgi:hypothetical protein